MIDLLAAARKLRARWLARDVYTTVIKGEADIYYIKDDLGDLWCLTKCEEQNGQNKKI